MKNSRTPAIMADAAYAILIRDSRDFTGNFCIDDEVLAAEGVDLGSTGVPRRRPPDRHLRRGEVEPAPFGAPSLAAPPPALTERLARRVPALT